MINAVDISNFKVVRGGIETTRFGEFAYSRHESPKREELLRIGLSGSFCSWDGSSRFTIYRADRGDVNLVFPNVIEDITARVLIEKKIKEIERLKKERNKIEL